MDELLEILNDINDEVDYDTEDNLIDGKVFDSFSIITLIGEICETFDIEIGPEYMVNENFNSAANMWAMIQTILEEE